MLFDTDVLIWALRGSKKAAKEIDDDDSRFISAVNYMELMQGARNKQEQIKIKQFLSELEFTVLPIIEAISHRAMFFIEETCPAIRHSDRRCACFRDRLRTFAYPVQREQEAFSEHPVA